MLWSWQKNGFIAVHDDSSQFYQDLIDDDNTEFIGDSVGKMLKLGYKKIEPYSYLARNSSSQDNRERPEEDSVFLGKVKMQMYLPNSYYPIKLLS